MINLGALQMRMDNFEAAMKAFDRAFALNPQSAAAYNDRGSLYLQTGDYKMALRDFDMAIAMQNDFALAMFNRGIVFLRQGNHQAPSGLFESRSLRPPRGRCVFSSRVCKRCLGRARSRAQGL